MNKNKIWTKGHQIKGFKVFPDDRGGDFLELAPQLTYIKYYEDVVDPSIHVDISVADAHGIINKLPVRSGSGVKLKYLHPSNDDEIELDLVVTNIIGHTIDNKKEIYTLICEREGALSNHTTRVTKKYTDLIHNSVKDILTIIDKELFKMDTATNKCRFYGNYRRPFKCIADLCRKSIPTTVDGESATTGSAGFLFYETLDGYNFRSIDKIFEEGGKDAEPGYEIFEYKMTAFKVGLDPKNNFMLASDPIFKESHDIIKKLRLGTYSTNNWYYDVITRKVFFHNFRYNESVKKANDKEVVPSDYKAPASRIILGALDSGTMSVDKDGKGTDAPQDQARLQAQSASRYSALFSQLLEITVPMNLNLRVGRLIKVNFPNINTDKSLAKNSPESGIYMIARLSHEMGNPDGDFTGLTLVRDSFTIHE